jgi:hypothetical protein
MQPSNTLVSNYIAELYEANEVIQNSLLIGEQICFINDAGNMYNSLRELVTPAYLTDDEFAWMKKTANGWNDITHEYNRQMGNMGDADMRSNMEDLQDQIQDMLDDYRDLMDGGD